MRLFAVCVYPFLGQCSLFYPVLIVSAFRPIFSIPPLHSFIYPSSTALSEFNQSTGPGASPGSLWARCGVHSGCTLLHTPIPLMCLTCFEFSLLHSGLFKKHFSLIFVPDVLIWKHAVPNIHILLFRLEGCCWKSWPDSLNLLCVFVLLQHFCAQTAKASMMVVLHSTLDATVTRSDYTSLRMIRL